MSNGVGEKTEKPTEKRLRDARRKGQVSKSQDLTSAFLLITVVVILAATGPWAGARLALTMRDSLIRAAAFKGSLDMHAALSAILSGVYSLAIAIAPLFVGLVAIGVLVTYLQVGPVFAFEPVKPTLNRLNPVEGFKNKFLKARPYLELCKTVLKIIVIGAVTCLTLWDSRNDVLQLAQHPVPRAAALTALLLLGIVAKVGIMFLILAIGDFFLQRFLYLKELRMTKHEVKEEFKETEGNPLHKIARRQVHREILMHSLIMAIKKADVVVVNPSHYAVALQYDRASMNAPTVVASGMDFMAAHIRRMATECGVPIMRDVQLARALFRIEIDHEIPEDLYEAVAVVLRWVYQLAEERGDIARHA
jgi:flagellar biosynthetic protein FlhB